MNRFPLSRSALMGRLCYLGVGGGAIAALLTTLPAAQAQPVDCRQVAHNQGAPFYEVLPQRSTLPDFTLAKGNRVRIDPGSAEVRGGDGRAYRFVTSPYNAQNTVTGFVPVQINVNGTWRNTLENCRRRMW